MSSKRSKDNTVINNIHELCVKFFFIIKTHVGMAKSEAAELLDKEAINKEKN